MNGLENSPHIGQRWEEVEKELFTPEENDASDLRVAQIGELIKARNERGYKSEEVRGDERRKAICHCPNGERQHKSAA